MIEKHQRGDNKPRRNKDGEGWRRLTRIANDELEKFRLNFSRCTNRDVAPLILNSSCMRINLNFKGQCWERNSGFIKQLYQNYIFRTVYIKYYC